MRSSVLPSKSRIILPRERKIIAPWKRPIRRRGPTDTAYNLAVLADSPVLFWGLSDASGTEAADLSGNGRVGVYDGVTLGAAGVVQDGTTAVSGLNQAGASRTGAIGANANLMTAEWAFRPTSLPVNGSSEMVTWNNGTFSGMAALVSNALGAMNVGAALGSPLTLPDGTFVVGTNYLVAYTFDGTNGRFYINGALAAGPTAQPATGSSALNFAAFGWITGIELPMQSTFHKFAIYNTQLSAARVLAHFNASGI